jgi:hypothetical protein
MNESPTKSPDEIRSGTYYAQIVRKALQVTPEAAPKPKAPTKALPKRKQAVKKSRAK